MPCRHNTRVWVPNNVHDKDLGSRRFGTSAKVSFHTSKLRFAAMSSSRVVTFVEAAPCGESHNAAWVVLVLVEAGDEPSFGNYVNVAVGDKLLLDMKWIVYIGTLVLACVSREGTESCRIAVSRGGPMV